MTNAARLAGVRGVLLDLDGTVHEAGRLIPGARTAVDSIRGTGPDAIVGSIAELPRLLGPPR